MGGHRGLKLAKSRIRKPGVGEHGLYDLTDAALKPLRGIVEKGLEAALEEIEAFLPAGLQIP